MHNPLNKRRSVAISSLIALLCSFLSIFASPAAAQSRCAGDPLVEWTNRSITSGRGLGGVLDAAPFTGELSGTAAAGVYTVRTLSADSGPTRASDVAETDESWTAVFLDASDNEVGRTPFTRDLADGVASVESADTFTVRLTGEATSVRVDHKILDANAPANSVSPLCIGLTAASGSTASGSTGSGSAGSDSAGSGSAATGGSTDAPAKAPCATNPNIPFDSTSCGGTSAGSGTAGSGSGAAGSGSADTGAAAAPKAPCATNPTIPFDSTSCGAAGSGTGTAGSGAAGSGAAGAGTAGTGTGAAGDAAGTAKPVCLANPAIPFDSTSCDPNAPKAACSTNSAIPFDSTSCSDASVLGETVDAPAAGGTDGAAAGSGTDAAAGGAGTGDDAAAGSGAAGSGAAAGGAAAGADGSPTVDGTLAITGAGTVVALTLVFGCLMVAGGIAAMNAASRREIFG